MGNKIKHLEMIQSVINRLASNSFRVKHWTVVLVAVVLSLLVREKQLVIGVYVAFPVLVFWGLDGYFLGIEKRFRAAYNETRLKRESEIDFSMDIRPLTFANWTKAVFSVTLCVFYFAIICAVIFFSLYFRGDKI